VSHDLIVIKLGGEVVGGDALKILSRDIAEASKRHEVIIVHGGGPQATELQHALGQKPQKIAGRRVTDAATLDVMKMILGGKLNIDLCSAIAAHGALPLGLTAASARVISAVRRPPKVYSGAGEDPVDLGFVGDVTSINTSFLKKVLGDGIIPVLACLGADGAGQVYNINADIVANRVASEMRARSLVLVSDVIGVLRDVSDPASRIPRVSVADGARLIAEGVVRDGMIPKLEESFATLREGAGQIHIVGKLGAGDLEREIASPGSVGTVLVA
jgi:acetylglutamate kinase